MKPLLPRLANGVLVVLGLGVASVWLVVAAAHLSDRYGLGHVAGSWIGLAWYARAGVLYPPLHSDGFYGGARCGPIPILLHGWGYRATGDPIAAGKLVGVAGTALMLTAGFVLLRRAGTPVGLAAVAVAVILMTDVGWQAGTTVNADGLAAGLQLAAVALVGRGGRFGSVAAGGACAAAFYVKASGGLGAARPNRLPGPPRAAVVTPISCHRGGRRCGAVRPVSVAERWADAGELHLLTAGR